MTFETVAGQRDVARALFFARFSVLILILGPRILPDQFYFSASPCYGISLEYLQIAIFPLRVSSSFLASFFFVSRIIVINYFSEMDDTPVYSCVIFSARTVSY